MLSRSGVLILFIALVLLAGWLFSDDLEHPDLASVVKNIEQTLRQLQGDIKDLKSSVKELSRNNKRGKQPQSIEASNKATKSIPAWQRHQEAYDRGRHLEDQKQYNDAIEAFSQAIDLDPKSDAAFLHRGYCRYHLGDFANAVADLTQSLSLQPNNSQAYSARALALADSGQTAAALADAAEMIRRFPSNAENYMLRANLHQRAGETQPAIDDFTQAIALAPQSEKAYLGRAAVLRSQGQLAPSLKDCYKAIELNPADPAAYLCRAEFYVASGAAQPAIEDINRALLNGQNPAQTAGMLSAAKQLLENKETASQPSQPSNTPEPLVDVSRAVPPSVNPPVPANVVTLPPASGMPAPAAPLPSPAVAPVPPKAVAAVPVAPVPPAVTPRVPASSPRNLPAARVAPSKGANADSLYRQGRRFSADEKFEQAMPFYDQAIQLDPNFALALNARCYAHLRLLEYHRAIADCSEAIRVNPSYWNAYQNRAVARQRAGDRAGANEDFHQATKFQPVAQVQNQNAGQRR